MLGVTGSFSAVQFHGLQVWRGFVQISDYSFVYPWMRILFRRYTELLHQLPQPGAMRRRHNLCYTRVLLV
jgi:hypothetical protein